MESHPNKSFGLISCDENCEISQGNLFFRFSDRPRQELRRAADQVRTLHMQLKPTKFLKADVC